MALSEKQRRQWERFQKKMVVTKDQKKKRASLCEEYWPDDCRRTLKIANELLEHVFLFQLPWRKG